MWRRLSWRLPAARAEAAGMQALGRGEEGSLGQHRPDLGRTREGQQGPGRGDCSAPRPAQQREPAALGDASSLGGVPSAGGAGGALRTCSRAW